MFGINKNLNVGGKKNGKYLMVIKSESLYPNIFEEKYSIT